MSFKTWLAKRRKARVEKKKTKLETKIAKIQEKLNKIWTPGKTVKLKNVFKVEKKLEKQLNKYSKQLTKFNKKTSKQADKALSVANLKKGNKAIINAYVRVMDLKISEAKTPQRKQFLIGQRDFNVDKMKALANAGYKIHKESTLDSYKRNGTFNVDKYNVIMNHFDSEVEDTAKQYNISIEDAIDIVFDKKIQEGVIEPLAQGEQWGYIIEDEKEVISPVE